MGSKTIVLVRTLLTLSLSASVPSREQIIEKLFSHVAGVNFFPSTQQILIESGSAVLWARQNPCPFSQHLWSYWGARKFTLWVWPLGWGVQRNKEGWISLFLQSEAAPECGREEWGSDVSNILLIVYWLFQKMIHWIIIFNNVSSKLTQLPRLYKCI